MSLETVEKPLDPQFFDRILRPSASGMMPCRPHMRCVTCQSRPRRSFQVPDHHGVGLFEDLWPRHLLARSSRGVCPKRLPRRIGTWRQRPRPPDTAFRRQEGLGHEVPLFVQATRLGEVEEQGNLQLQCRIGSGSCGNAWKSMEGLRLKRQNCLHSIPASDMSQPLLCLAENGLPLPRSHWAPPAAAGPPPTWTGRCSGRRGSASGKALDLQLAAGLSGKDAAV